MKPGIAICINSMRIGGTERVVSILLSHLKDVFDIHLVLYNTVIEYPVPEEVKIFSLEQSSSESNLSWLIKGPVLSYRLTRYCRHHNIKTVVAFLNRPCYLAALMKSLWLYKGRLVMCQRTHQTTLVKYGSPTYRLLSNQLFQRSFSRADLVLANSQAIESDLRNYLPAKIPVAVINNPIDFGEIRHLAASGNSAVFAPGIFHFMVVGGLRTEKNHSMLLKAFSLLKGEPAKLWIVGGGELEERLKGQAKDLGISSSVEFCGFSSNPFPLLAKADCMVLPSRVEGFPNVLLEALACKKLVISTDCLSGPREILDPHPEKEKKTEGGIEFADYGILVPVDRPEILAEAMRTVMQQPDLKLKYASQAEEAVKKFDIQHLKADFVKAFSPPRPR